MLARWFGIATSSFVSAFVFVACSSGGPGSSGLGSFSFDSSVDGRGIRIDAREGESGDADEDMDISPSDSGQDTASWDAPSDTAPPDAPPDTGPKVCVNYCTTHLECQQTCPAPPVGATTCCDVFSGICYASSGGCDPVDAGAD